MKNLVSLNCSSECIEKSLTLFYNTIKSNNDFYEKYMTIIYYGNDLSKNNLSSIAIGSVRFYQDVSNDTDIIEKINEERLLKNKKDYLLKLLEKNFINYNNYISYLKNDKTYLNMIYNIPFKWIDDRIVIKIKNSFEKKYNVKFCDLYVENDINEFMGNIKKNYSIYKIYGLNIGGNIGKYKILTGKKYYHILKEISKNIVISGNTAFLIKSISTKLKKDSIIGYRKQEKHARIGQMMALEEIIKNNESIEEPKNKDFNDIYNEFSGVKPYELNYFVIKKAFIKMLEEILK